MLQRTQNKHVRNIFTVLQGEIRRLNKDMYAEGGTLLYDGLGLN